MNHSIIDLDLTRRQALAIGATAALAMPGTAVAAPATEHPWIDAHSHIWTRDIAKYPLAKGVQLEDLQPASFTTEELLALAGQNGVGRVVLIQHSKFYEFDNAYMIDAAKEHPQKFRIVGMIDTFSANPGQQMKDLLTKRVTGFRITPRIYQDKWLAGGMPEMWRTAATTGQKICCLINTAELPEVDAMCTKHPDTPMVIDHFARIGVDGEFREADIAAMCKFARHKQTYVKISAFYALGQKKPPYLELIPMIRRLLDSFGPERLMWASDAPYQLDAGNTYAASLALVKEKMDFLSAGDRDWLLRKTAEKVFFYQ